jgi:uncharacterized membrane protein YhaH (DUF805 family)
MTDSAPTPSTDPKSPVVSYRGRIGRGSYALMVLISAACIVGALFGAAGAANPKGSDAGLFLTFPLLIAFILIFPPAVVKRLHDAGWSRGAKFAFALMPIFWIFLTILMPNYFHILIPLGAAAVVLIPLMAGPLPNQPKPEA